MPFSEADAEPIVLQQHIVIEAAADDGRANLEHQISAFGATITCAAEMPSDGAKALHRAAV
jgi:hypothetical protein